MAGTRAVRDVLLDQSETRALRVSVVWVPMLDADELPLAVRDSAQLAGRDVTQYWDGERRLGDAVRTSAGLPASSAWGTYLYYRPGVEWLGPGAPRPDILLKDAYGMIVVNRGALRRQDGVPEPHGGFAACCEVVGAPANLPRLLYDAAVRAMAPAAAAPAAQ